MRREFTTPENFVLFLRGQEYAFKSLAPIAKDKELKKLCERKATNRRLLAESIVAVHEKRGIRADWLQECRNQ